MDIDIVGAAKSCDKCESFYSICTSCTMRHPTSGDCNTCLGLHFPTVVARSRKQKEENANSYVVRTVILQRRSRIYKVKLKIFEDLGWESWHRLDGLMMVGV